MAVIADAARNSRQGPPQFPHSPRTPPALASPNQPQSRVAGVVRRFQAGDDDTSAPDAWEGQVRDLRAFSATAGQLQGAWGPLHRYKAPAWVPCQLK